MKQRLKPTSWTQKFNSYIVDKDNIVVSPQAVWTAASEGRFNITKLVPPNNAQDPFVLSVGPFTDDYKIAIFISHLKPGDSNFTESKMQEQYVSIQRLASSNSSIIPNTQIL
jgi:hypothetical protein